VYELTPSPENRRKRRGWGREITILLIVAIVLTAAFILYRPVHHAKQIEQELNDLYGYAETFVPAADGSIAPERIGAFLRVREQIFRHCPGFQAKITAILQPDRTDGIKNPPGAEVALERTKKLKKILGFGPAFLDFMDTRHRALLTEEMGLGEYMYIYTLAYSKQLGRAGEGEFARIEEAYVGRRARTELIQMLNNQLDLLTSPDAVFTDPGFEANLRNQIERLEDGRQTLPWENELPPAIAASIDPFADTLAGLYCEGIAKIELMQKNRGFNFRN
jgi:hypothetical protein